MLFVILVELVNVTFGLEQKRAKTVADIGEDESEGEDESLKIDDLDSPWSPLDPVASGLSASTTALQKTLLELYSAMRTLREYVVL